MCGVNGRRLIVLFKLHSIRWFMKMSVWSLARQQSVFQQYHSGKTFVRVLPLRWHWNYVTVPYVLLYQQTWKNVHILQLNLFTASLLVRSKSVKCYLLSNMLWMLSVSLRNTAHAACSTVQLLQYKTSSAAQRWTHMITVQDLWSHTALWIWVASQQYWRNQAATGWTPANH